MIGNNKNVRCFARSFSIQRGKNDSEIFIGRFNCSKRGRRTGRSFVLRQIRLAQPNH